MIKLSKLDPKTVASEVCEWMTSQIWSLGFHLDPSQVYRWPAPLHASGLGHSVKALVAYAQHGGELDAHPSDYVQTVAEALYTAAHPDVYGTVQGDWERKTADPVRAIDCVIRAALARERLTLHGQAAPIGWLGPLAGVSVASMRTYASSGELTVTKGDVAPAEAKRWLSGRGVQL